MIRYKSAGQDTGVTAFETGDNHIKIKFRDGSVYLYTAESAGAAAIAEMKALAKKGAGLSTYINRHVRDRYQSKLN